MEQQNDRKPQDKLHDDKAGSQPGKEGHKEESGKTQQPGQDNQEQNKNK